MWAGFVELIRVTIFSAAHLCAGSLGSGILAVSIVMRLALLPLTLRLARQAQLQQARLAALKPEIDALQKRFAKDPARLMREKRSPAETIDRAFLFAFGRAPAASERWRTVIVSQWVSVA